MPPAIVLALGAVGAAVLGRFAVREWRRVNAELERIRKASVPKHERDTLPKLQRDPSSGVYRP